MTSLRDLFGVDQPIIAMVHLRALPGSPHFDGDLDAVYAQALREARLLATVGVHGLLLENYADTPYTVGHAEPVQVACLAAVGREIRAKVSLPIGVNIQFNAWREEVALAVALGAAFLRAEAFVETLLTPQGRADACSAELMRELKRLGGQAAVFADLQVKHTVQLAPTDLFDSAREAVAAGARGLIVTGRTTGELAELETLRRVRVSAGVPVLAGSGVSASTIREVLQYADGVIVGSALKQNGLAHSPVDEDRVRAFMAEARASANVG